MTAAQLAAVASLLADRSRAAICMALLDGRAWTVGELARQAGIAPSTASEHVARLVDAGLLAAVQQGRHRYVRLADARTAQFVEDLAAYATPASAPDPRAAPRSLRAVSTAQALARARTCYDHLAGRLGVRITDALTDSGVLDQTNGLTLTKTGIAWLESALDVDVAALRASRRPLVRSCLDWTERRPHLGGAAGAAICDRFLTKGWIARVGTGRAVRVSPAGQQALRDICGIDSADDVT
ncbi:MAG TPA: winged helix-turn-helix domain-containing protein [Streptosporangiaceae bacterium]